MGKYVKVLKNEIVLDLLLSFILCIVIILGTIFIIKLFLHLEIEFKYRVITCIVSSLFLIGIFITTYFQISKPILDIKEKSFVQYSGIVERAQNRSNKHTDVYQLIDVENVFVYAPNGTMETSISKCRAYVVYGKNSRKVVELRRIEKIEDDSVS